MIFPLTTSCSLRTYGGSGNLQNTEALCVVPLNITHRIIYIVLWFWLVFLAAFAFVHLLCLFLEIASSYFRRSWLRRMSPTSTLHVS